MKLEDIGYIIHNNKIHTCEITEIHTSKYRTEYTVRYSGEDGYLSLRTGKVFEAIQDLLIDLSKNVEEYYKG